jgi:outer membrane receptor protein involved in Fe transport
MTAPWRVLSAGALPAILLLGSFTLPLSAQQPGSRPPAQSRDTTPRPFVLDPIVSTATRSARESFATPNPVLAVDSSEIRTHLVNNAAELLRGLPGVDVTGVGPNQTRLIIRGQRGQRILLLEDGIRLNNERRQQDFGEIPALTDVNDLSRVEVVRGPASVLYGTDAIGGVVNLITRSPRPTATPEAHGYIGYRYTGAGGAQKPAGGFTYTSSRLTADISATYRDAGSYRAPAGTFGDLTLHSALRVRDTGVRDQNYAASLAYAVGTGRTVFARLSRYQADDAGFGYVSGGDLGDPNATTIRILYPTQTVNGATLGYRATGLSSRLADRFELTGYTRGNARVLTIGVTVPEVPPGPGIQSDSHNWTDLKTWGLRAEAVKAIGGSTVLTYGVDGFSDRSTNTDSSKTTITGFGPPMTDVSNTPSVPNATLQSAGAFLQAQFTPTERLTLMGGVRGQLIHAATRKTPRLDDAPVSSDLHTVVGSASALFGVTEAVHLVATVGRAFRAPDLVELYFNGPTPEGSAYQVQSPDLKPETSLNVDLGVKVRTRRVSGEAYVFRNSIHDGIRIAPTGTMVGPFPGYQNVNVDRIRDTGVELALEAYLFNGLDLRGNWTHVSSKDVLNPLNPVGDSYGSQAGFEARYRPGTGRFWVGYAIRHNGERSDVLLQGSPVGNVLPAFTVHSASLGLEVMRTGSLTHSLAITVDNLTNRLYSEASNTSFFRPEPGRNVVASWRVSF